MTRHKKKRKSVVKRKNVSKLKDKSIVNDISATTANVSEPDEAPTEEQPIAQSAEPQLDPNIVAEVDEIVATPTKKRVWEVDFLRGLMILFVVWDHLMWDIREFRPYESAFMNTIYDFAKMYGGSVLRTVTQPVFVTMFVFTSGVSCSFARNNLKRAVKMIVFALLFTAATAVASSFAQDNLTIRFNVIHVIALSVLLWSFVEWAWSKCTHAWQKNIFGAVMTVVVIASLVVGACAGHPDGAWKGSPIWYFLAEHDNNIEEYQIFMGGDYLPFLPSFGWFLIGAFLGKALYKEKKTLFPSVNEKWVAPITFCGRYSIWIYFASQVVMYGILYLLSEVLHCL